MHSVDQLLKRRNGKKTRAGFAFDSAKNGRVDDTVHSFLLSFNCHLVQCFSRLFICS